MCIVSYFFCKCTPTIDGRSWILGTPPEQTISINTMHETYPNYAIKWRTIHLFFFASTLYAVNIYCASWVLQAQLVWLSSYIRVVNTFQLLNRDMSSALLPFMMFNVKWIDQGGQLKQCQYLLFGQISTRIWIHFDRMD